MSPAGDESATIADTLLDGSWVFHTTHTTVSTEGHRPHSFSFLAVLRGLWGLAAPTWDRTQALDSESAEC